MYNRTMAGRRINEAVVSVLLDNGFEEPLYPESISLTNEYSSYVTTYEEYQIQRYEGASTIHGPHTLQAYTQELEILAEILATDQDLVPNEPPPDLRGFPSEALDDVRIDDLPFGVYYGDVIVDANPSYLQGETVSVTFYSGNPRLSHQSGQSYLEVQRNDSGTWILDKTDAYWETRFYWNSDCADAGIFDLRCISRQSSNVTIQWDIPVDQQPGAYRIMISGNAKTFNDVVTYTGTSSSVEVTVLNGKRQSIYNSH